MKCHILTLLDLGFGQKDASRERIHLALKLEARKIKFMYPRSKQGNFDETTDMLSFYAYLNRVFRRIVTPREGDGTKIPAYNKNPLKSCGYVPYLMHMIERVTARTFFYEKEHHPLRIKNDLRAPVEESRAAAPHFSPPRVARGRGQPRDKPPSPIQKIFSLLFGMCKSQHAVDVRANMRVVKEEKLPNQ
jgi:hypothetical protein